MMASDIKQRQEGSWERGFPSNEEEERYLPLPHYDTHDLHSRVIYTTPLSPKRPEWARYVGEGGNYSSAAAVTTPTKQAEMRGRVPRVYASSLAGGGGPPSSVSDTTGADQIREYRMRMVKKEDGVHTFGNQYMPFAAGFDHMSGEAPIYRSRRLHYINPTASVSEDMSYYFQLDNLKKTAATRGADPEFGSREHVRNTRLQSKGGWFNSLMQPIK
jgi:hypothetical protein